MKARSSEEILVDNLLLEANNNLLMKHIDELEKKQVGLLYKIAELERALKDTQEDNLTQKDKVYKFETLVRPLFRAITNNGDLNEYRHFLKERLEEVIGDEYSRANK